MLFTTKVLFVAIKIFFRDKNIILFRQKFCRAKHTFVETKDVFYRYKHEFVATKMILMAAPANDRDGVLMGVFVNGSLC